MHNEMLGRVMQVYGTNNNALHTNPQCIGLYNANTPWAFYYSMVQTSM